MILIFIRMIPINPYYLPVITNVKTLLGIPEVPRWVRLFTINLRLVSCNLINDISLFRTNNQVLTVHFNFLDYPVYRR